MAHHGMADGLIDHISQARSVAAWTNRPAAGWMRMDGADRIDLLHRLTTNDLTALRPGMGRQTVLLTEKARIIDVITILEHTSHAYVITSSAPATVLAWLKKFIIMDDVRLRDETETVQMLEIMGPRSGDVVQQLTGMAVAALAKTDWLQTDEQDPVTIVRMPSSCEVSYWLIASSERIEQIREALAQASNDIPQLTEAEDEYLRVTAGMGRLGYEWTEAFNPLEAGLLHLTSFTKGCYIGQEVVARLDSYNKVKQRVMGFTAQHTIAPGDPIVVDGATVGVITSVVPGRHTPTLALGYIRGEHAVVDTVVTVRHGDTDVPSTIHLPPMSE